MDYSNILFKSRISREYYEPLLVEDIVVNHPLEVHYGKCSVIGKIQFHETDKLYYLESLRIPTLPQNLQLPDSFFRIRLLTGLLRGNMNLNRTVEIIGEIVLWNQEVPNHDPENLLPKTSNDLCLQLRKHCKILIDKVENHDQLTNLSTEDQKEIEQCLIKFQRKYKIVLRPFHILPTSHAGDIISLNLELKKLRAMHAQATGYKLDKI